MYGRVEIRVAPCVDNAGLSYIADEMYMFFDFSVKKSYNCMVDESLFTHAIEKTEAVL